MPDPVGGAPPMGALPIVKAPLGGVNPPKDGVVLFVTVICAVTADLSKLVVDAEVPEASREKNKYHSNAHHYSRYRRIDLDFRLVRLL